MIEQVQCESDGVIEYMPRSWAIPDIIRHIVSMMVAFSSSGEIRKIEWGSGRVKSTLCNARLSIASAVSIGESRSQYPCVLKWERPFTEAELDKLFIQMIISCSTGDLFGSRVRAGMGIVHPPERNVMVSLVKEGNVIPRHDGHLADRQPIRQFHILQRYLQILKSNRVYADK